MVTAAAKQPRTKEPYNLAPEFERVVVYYACSRPRFFGMVGSYVDPELLGLPAGKHALEVARQIHTETGVGPDSTLIVLQRLKRLEGEGKITRDQIREVYALFEEVEDGETRPSEENVAGELAPVLQRRKQAEAMTASFEEFAAKGDFARVVELINEAGRIGTSDASMGTMLGNAAFTNIERTRRIQRLATGIRELDDILGGGLVVGCEGIFIADSGGGKSMALNHVACSGLHEGLNVAYATLELPEDIIQARLISHVTNVEITRITDTDEGLELARSRWAKVAPILGSCVVKEFSPMATKVADITEWLARHESEAGLRVDLLVVDYADKIVAPKGKDANEYTTGKVVYEGLRLWAKDNQRWLWTASQATRPKSDKKRKRIDLGDVADSMHKVRVGDVVVTINPETDEEGEQVTALSYFLAKNRLGLSRRGTPALPHEWEFGRCIPVDWVKF